MDCYFNRYIPKSSEDRLIIRPASKTWWNGMSESYSFRDYDPKLMEWQMSQKEFDKMIETINDSIWNYYPCPGCQGFAYFCCLCTLGCSCIIPTLQVNEAKQKLDDRLQQINRSLLGRRMRLEHKMEHSTSYIILYLPNNKIWQNPENLV